MTLTKRGEPSRLVTGTPVSSTTAIGTRPGCLASPGWPALTVMRSAYVLLTSRYSMFMTSRSCWRYISALRTAAGPLRPGMRWIGKQTRQAAGQACSRQLPGRRIACAGGRAGSWQQQLAAACCSGRCLRLLYVSLPALTADRLQPCSHAALQPSKHAHLHPGKRT